MITCTRRLEFDAGHRVVGHETKCKHLHGHRYVVEITCALTIELTDTLGRVVDYGVIKERVGGWIDEHLDHGLILWDADRTLSVLRSLRVGGDEHQKIYLLHVNPTAENLAAHLLEKATELLPDDVTPIRVRVWETPNCYADAIDARHPAWLA